MPINHPTDIGRPIVPERSDSNEALRGQVLSENLTVAPAQRVVIDLRQRLVEQGVQRITLLDRPVLPSSTYMSLIVRRSSFPNIVSENSTRMPLSLKRCWMTAPTLAVFG